MKLSSRCLMITILVLSANTAVAGDDRAAVIQAFTDWQQALASGKPEQVVKLYEPDATLLATLNAAPINDNTARTTYFTKLMQNPKLQVTVQEKRIDMHGPVAVVTGTYTFSYEKDGSKMQVPARYTFVYEKHSDGWLIENHHSSKVP